MTRALLVLTPNTREKAAAWLRKAPDGTRVEFRAPRRSLDQNAKLWALLTDVAEQAQHCGQRYPAEVWKTLFMQAFGREVRFLPTLDGSSVFPLGFRSSELTKAEMSELIEFIQVWGAERGVAFHTTEMHDVER